MARTLSATLSANQKAMGDNIWKVVLTFSGTSWASSTAYAVGDRVIPTTPNGRNYRCTTAGTSGGTEPTWTTTVAATVSDGTVTWTDNGLVTQTYATHGTTNVLIEIDHTEEEENGIATLIIDNTDTNLTDLDLKGFTATISYGYTDPTAGDEYSATAPLIVLDKELLSSDSDEYKLTCELKCAGIPSLLAEDYASDDYSHDETDTKTVKDMITEILDGTAVSSTLTTQNTTEDSNYNLYGALYNQVGQKVTISEKTVSSLSFKLKKVGSPTGNITYIIRASDESEDYASGTTSASALTSTETWTKVSFTPVAITDEVYLLCDYTGGDASNYVQISYNSSDVVGSSDDDYLVYLLATGTYVNQKTYDCAYKYEYSSAGIGVFSHCTSYTATYDSEDSLIDVYQPADAFEITKNESRLSVLNRLISYTGCFYRAEDDGEIHIFTKPTSSSEDFSLSSGDHNFYIKSHKDGIVRPNYVEVASFPDDTNQYSGSATSSESNGLKDLREYREVKLASDAQAASIASAVISRAELEASGGAALIPLHTGLEVWDYITITDSRQDDSISGNIAYIRRVCRPGLYQMEVRFGKVPLKGVAGTKPSKALTVKERQPDWEDLNAIVDYYDNIVTKVVDALKEIATRLTWLEDKAITKKYLRASYYSKYQVDYKLTSITNLDVTASRAFDTVYTNGSGKIRFVSVQLQCWVTEQDDTTLDGKASAIAYTDSSNPPTTIVTTAGIEPDDVLIQGNNDDLYLWIALVFWVEPGNYYKVAQSDNGGGTSTIQDWQEWDLF